MSCWGDLYLPLATIATLRRLIIVLGGLITSPWVVPVLVLVVPGMVFLVLVDVVASHYVYYH